MVRKWNVWRSLFAGTVIGFSEAVRREGSRSLLRRPAGVVWLDDRRRPDPLVGIPLLLLDPVTPRTPGDSDVRREGPLRLALHSPVRLLRRLGHRWHAGQ